METPPDKMKYIYIVLEMTNNGSVIYPETYKTYEAALEAIRTKMLMFLEDDAEANGGSAEETWQDSVKHSRVEKNVTYLYIEKENYFEIHKLPVPA